MQRLLARELLAGSPACDALWNCLPRVLAPPPAPAHAAAPPPPTRRQTYTAPQSTGQYRFIFGDGTVDLPGEVLDSAKPTEEQKSRMTDKQVRGVGGAGLSGVFTVG